MQRRGREYIGRIMVKMKLPGRSQGGRQKKIHGCVERRQIDSWCAEDTEDRESQDDDWLGQLLQDVLELYID